MLRQKVYRTVFTILPFTGDQIGPNCMASGRLVAICNTHSEVDYFMYHQGLQGILVVRVVYDKFRVLFIVSRHLLYSGNITSK